MDWQDLEPGGAYACEFTIETMLTDQLCPPTRDTDVLKGIGTYTSIGIIQERDLQNQRARVIDTRTRREFVVDFKDTAHIDTITWTDNTVI